MSDKIIYIVTSGEYSDYRIEAVFSNKEDAQYLADSITENGYDNAEVEEYPQFQVEVRDGEEPVMTKNNITSTITPVTCANKFFQEWLDISKASQPVTIYLLDNEGNPIRAFDKVTTEWREELK